MSLLVPTASQLTFLDNIRTAGKLLNATLHLYVSNYTPVLADVAATYNAIEAAFGGYAAQTITDWGAAATVSAKAKTVAGNYTFTASGTGLPATVYGIYVLDASGNLLYAEKNPTGGVTLSSAGHTFSYQPAFTLTTG
jgi:hypothetical protein